MTADKLRTLLDGDELIVAPGVYDGISASVVGRLGFRAAYMTGAGVAAAGYGLPDIGLVTLTEMTDRARMLARVLDDIPLIADADTGYGSPVNAARTVTEYERAGVAAIQLEDQTFPKRCGHLTGKEVVEADDFARTLDAALTARTDALIVARTDVLSLHGVDAAIARAQRYVAIGADLIFVEAPSTIAEIEQIAAEVDAPLLLNLVPGGRTPDPGAARLTELGYRMTIHPGAALRAVADATITALGELAGVTEPDHSAAGLRGFFELFDLARWNAIGAPQ
ncbi:2,3-dimethylmalate lyase [Paraconexibacter sp. AEG42_29]|uniref:2,3-dimethylmalate lyase n=1 Tax=Paraconexibacter sp. AEG42_29 TaxID=2997339 RepID=A0AAU7AUA5_9ACTN